DFDEGVENTAAPREWRRGCGAPGRVGEMMVEGNNSQSPFLGFGETRGGALQLSGSDRTSLVAKRPRRVEPHDLQARQRRDRLGRVPDALELCPRPHEAGGRVRQVVVPRHREHRRTERAEELSCALELLAPATM